MRYLSVCSGIESATSAWHHLGWEPVAFSEIDAFPSAVLKHHYPNVPNLGDMSKFKEWNLGSIDLLVGGTPCQSFSVAGLRKGLDDPRGNLMLTFGAIARHFSPRWLVWENVPGVLSSNGGRDFGTFLGMLGELGYGFAYRVLDAQYFGVAQRRRRVFVVGCLGNWRDAAAVLFELSSLSGNPPPRRETGKGTASGSAAGPQYGGSNQNIADTVTSKWAKGSGGPAGNECGLFVAQPTVLMDQGGSVMEVRTDGTVGTLRRETHGHEPVIMQPVDVPEVMSTLLSSTAGISRPGNAATEHETYIPVAYRKSKRAQTADDDESWVEDGVANTINLFDQGDVRTTHAVVQPIAFSSNMSVPDCQIDVSPTLKLGGQGGGNPPAIAFNGDQSEKTRSMGESLDHTPTLRADGPCHVATMAVGTDCYNGAITGDVAATMGTPGSSVNASGPTVMQSMAVRRLTPRECERLQGFPDDHTLIPWRGKPAQDCPDGPRYKALGNSMAVPVMAWIGERIRMVNELPK